jgi:hypothetical protein
MAGLRFAELQSRPIEFLDFTSVTLEDFQQLVPPFEAAFQARMAAWRMDGKPRTARRFTMYKNCPLPTPEDRLFFLLTYLKTYTLQVVHGRLFGMVQGKANQWIHVLLPALLAALRVLGEAPACSLTALAQRLGVAEADAAPVVVPREEEQTPATVVVAPAVVPTSPLLPMMAPNGGSSAPKTRLTNGEPAQTDTDVMRVAREATTLATAALVEELKADRKEESEDELDKRFGVADEGKVGRLIVEVDGDCPVLAGRWSGLSHGSPSVQRVVGADETS